VLDRVGGTVAYAVIKTGGLLASHYHQPVLGDALRFEPAHQAFVVELTLEDLRVGPSEFDEDDFDWGDRAQSYPHPLIGWCSRGRSSEKRRLTLRYFRPMRLLFTDSRSIFMP
jgi:hypothetical protein